MKGWIVSTYVPERKRNTMLVAVSYQYPYYEEPELGIHERMRKADFGTVDGAIAGCFDYCKETGVLWIEYYVTDRILSPVESANCFNFGSTDMYLDHIKIRHCAEFYLGNPVRRRKGSAKALKSTECYRRICMSIWRKLSLRFGSS